MRVSSLQSVFERAAELVKGGWCQHYAALDKAGYSVKASSMEAVQWCLLGGLARASCEQGNKWLYSAAYEYLTQQLGIHHPSSWNDSELATQGASGRSSTNRSQEVGGVNKIAFILDKAADIVAKGWCQEDTAVDDLGLGVATSSEYAIEWCALGGVEKAITDYARATRGKA